jgi:hypothetical protein
MHVVAAEVQSAGYAVLTGREVDRFVTGYSSSERRSQSSIVQRGAVSDSAEVTDVDAVPS